MPMIPFPGNNMNNICQKDLKNDNISNECKEVNKENENNEKIMPQVFVRAPIFFNQINKQKNFYCKYQQKKTKPFAERTGDWYCNNCRNLNFSFRLQCNRCKMPKKEAMEFVNNKDDNKNNENFENLKKNKKCKKFSSFNYNISDSKEEQNTTKIGDKQ